MAITRPQSNNRPAPAPQAGQPEKQTQAAKPAPAPQQKHETSGMEEFKRAGMNSLLGERKVQAVNLAAASVNPWTYEEIVGQPHNAALIAASVKEIQKVMMVKGLDPAGTGVTFMVDITGHQVSVCLACGVEGHDYMPTMVRRLNPEVNMLDEYVSVAHAIASKVGMNFSIVTYDEEVLPLRDFGPPANDGERVLQRFQMFRERHEGLDKTIVNGVIQDWMVKEMAKWTPADNTKQLVGQPNDTQAIGIAEKLMGGSDGLKGVMLAKAKAPVSIRPFEAKLQAKGIKATGVAVGAQAEQAAPQMFRQTLVIKNMHDLRGQVAPSVVSMLE
jgi:hypothetical protein